MLVKISKLNDRENILCHFLKKQSHLVVEIKPHTPFLILFLIHPVRVVWQKRRVTSICKNGIKSGSLGSRVIRQDVLPEACLTAVL